MKEIALAELAGDGAMASFSAWRDTYCVLQWAEIRSCLGGWLDAASPVLGPATAASFALTRQLDRRRIGEAVERRERIHRSLRRFLGPQDLLCLPTTPALAPRLAEADPDRSPQGSGSGSTYYPRTLSLTSVAGLGRLPQVSLPMAEVSGVPVGLSLLASHGQDGFLLDVVRRLA